jgi:hypothetical protein
MSLSKTDPEWAVVTLHPLHPLQADQLAPALVLPRVLPRMLLPVPAWLLVLLKVRWLVVLLVPWLATPETLAWRSYLLGALGV